MAGNESKIPTGQILVGKYRVVREIGRGGMAAVYESEQLSLGKKIAVKILASELAASTIVIERFFREARAAASVKSPYIVDVYDSGRLDDGRPFIAMELLEGESLYDRMARVRIIDVETTMRVITHTAKGLIKAHGAGIVHRDLKPENIFLTRGEDGEDVCKILDFGLAKFYAPVNPEEKAAKRLTREGAVFGTPAYMSPEQVKGQGNVDHRADLWAVGCMAYECLIGRPVWNMDQGVAMTFAAIATGPIPVPSAARADLPASFDAWFLKCLERDPDLRYQSAKELSEAYVEAWGAQPTASASYPKLPSSRLNKANPFTATQDASPPSPQIPPGPLTPRGMPDLRGSVGSDASAPIPLVVTRPSADVPPAPEPLTPVPTVKPSPIRLVMSGAFLFASLSIAGFVWSKYVNPQVFAPVVQSTASAVPTGSSAELPTQASEEPKWVAQIADAQKTFLSDPAATQKRLGELVQAGGPGATVAKVMAEQLKITSARDPKDTCKVTSFSRPRWNWDRPAARPAIVSMPKGTLVAWTDDHEAKDKDEVYGILLDGIGKPIGNVHLLTPESQSASRPQLVSNGDRTVLMWGDNKGKDAGVHVRFLDGDGRINLNKGSGIRIGAAKPGEFWPQIEKGREGFIVVWQEDRDKQGEYDIFVRRLSTELETLSDETRLTDYYVRSGKAPKIRYPNLAIAPNTLFIAYRLERPNGEKGIFRLRLPLDDLQRSEKNHGLPESKDPNRDSRVLGDVTMISDEKAGGDAPALACGKEGCFAVWHGETGGAWVAYIDPTLGKAQWKRKISEKGGHPALGVNEQGQVAVSWYDQTRDGSRIKFGFLTRDPGVAQSTTLLKMVEDTAQRPRPAVAPGTREGEWVIAWQDADAKGGAAEIYTAKIACGR